MPNNFSRWFIARSATRLHHHLETIIILADRRVRWCHVDWCNPETTAVIAIIKQVRAAIGPISPSSNVECSSDCGRTAHCGEDDQSSSRPRHAKAPCHFCG